MKCRSKLKIADLVGSRPLRKKIDPPNKGFTKCRVLNRSQLVLICRSMEKKQDRMSEETSRKTQINTNPERKVYIR